MWILKLILLALVFGTSSLIGIKLSNSYVIRANNLKQFKKALRMMEAKITYTYDMLPDLFGYISSRLSGDVGEVFRRAAEYMSVEFAGDAWEKCIDEANIFLKEDDKEALKSLGKLLGKTDVEGQLNQLRLVNEFLDEQIVEANQARAKNVSMYRKLGVIAGFALVVVLI